MALVDIRKAEMEYNEAIALLEWLENNQNANLLPPVQTALNDRVVTLREKQDEMKTQIEDQILALFEENAAMASPMWATLEEATSSLVVEFNTAMSGDMPPNTVDSMLEAPVIPDAFREELDAAVAEINDLID